MPIAARIVVLVMLELEQQQQHCNLVALVPLNIVNVVAVIG